MEGEALRPIGQLQSHSPHVNSALPATAPFNWPMHTKIPQVTPTQSADERAFTKRSYVKPSNLPEGDKVLAKSNPPHKKCTTPYDPNPNIVRGCKEIMVTAKRRDREITRNSSFFKTPYKVTLGRYIQRNYGCCART